MDDSAEKEVLSTNCNESEDKESSKEEEQEWSKLPLNGGEHGEENEEDVFDQTVFVSSILNQRQSLSPQTNQEQENQVNQEQQFMIPINDHEISVNEDGTLVLMTPLVPTPLPPFEGLRHGHVNGHFPQVNNEKRNILEETVREVFYNDNDSNCGGDINYCGQDDGTNYMDTSQGNPFNQGLNNYEQDDYRNDPNYDPADEEEEPEDDEYDKFGKKKRPKRSCVSMYQSNKHQDYSQRQSRSKVSKYQRATMNESSQDTNSSNEGSMSSKVSPFDDSIKIPLPGQMSFQLPFIEGGGCVRKRNERERARVRNVNDGFERLRAHLPPAWIGTSDDRDRRLSKVDTLRSAINYIYHLQAILRED